MKRHPLLLLALCASVVAVACKPGDPFGAPAPPAAPANGPAPQAPAAPPAPRAAAALPSLRVGKVATGAITVDGKLDEPVWKDCGTTGPLVSPMDGAPVAGSRVPAEFRVCASDTFLYVAALVKEKSPSSPFKRDDVDPHLWERSSAVEIMLQPGNPGDNKAYYEVQVDIMGAVWDTRFDDYNRPRGQGANGAPTYGHQDWDAKTQRAIVVDDAAGHYTVELAIPWTSLPSDRTAVPPKAGDVWRANFYSFRDGQRDALAWSPLEGRGNFHFVPRFGQLVFP